MKNVYIVICALIALASLTSCSTTGGGSSRPALAENQYDFPDWVLHPPLEGGAIYGVGSGETRPKAHIESLVDISFKLETQLNAVLAVRSRAKSDDKETVVTSLMNQVSITEVTGAKIMEEYQAPNGITWMLTRLPGECIMDLTESALVTYALNLKMKEDEITDLVNDVEQRLASERIVNSLLANEVEDTLEEDREERELEETRARIAAEEAEKGDNKSGKKELHWGSLIVSTAFSISGGYLMTSSATYSQVAGGIFLGIGVIGLIDMFINL